MNTVSILKDLKFSEEKPVVEVLLETDFTKEIRITLAKNQAMKKHQTPFPIVIELVEGEIIFGVEEKEFSVKKGDLLSLSGGVPHHLIAVEKSVVRLTLSKLDSEKRVQKVSEQ